ncbi:MAG: DUF5916 domain-containing protein, partial [candidate division WOR-3 bacterium]
MIKAKRMFCHLGLGLPITLNFLFGFVPYDFEANRLTKPPVIDGYLNDPCWEEATKIDKDFRNYILDDPEYGKIAPLKTIVFVGYDDKNLYIGFICVEHEMNKIRANAKKHGVSKEMLEDDRVEVCINPSTTKTDGYLFWVTPKGIRGPVLFGIEIRPRLLSESCILDNFIWFADAKILDTCWTVEIQIPFQSLRFYSNYIDTWRIDFGRVKAIEFFNVYHLSPKTRDEFLVTYYARMHIDDWIAKPEKVEFLPYLSGGLIIDTLSEPSLRLGLGGKYYFNYDNIIDFAVSPDFSQIETDVPQIDVNTTSALYYEEKRPFFIEKKTFFETPLEVFYSRMINDPLGASKYTGSLKDYSMGYIFGLDRHTPFILPFAERSFSLGSDKVSASNILRLKKTFLIDTYLGLLATDKEIRGGGFNRTFSL